MWADLQRSNLSGSQGKVVFLQTSPSEEKFSPLLHSLGIETAHASSGHSTWSFMSSNLQINIFWKEPQARGYVGSGPASCGSVSTFGAP